MHYVKYYSTNKYRGACLLFNHSHYKNLNLMWNSVFYYISLFLQHLFETFSYTVNWSVLGLNSALDCKSLVFTLESVEVSQLHNLAFIIFFIREISGELPGQSFMRSTSQLFCNSFTILTVGACVPSYLTILNTL